MEATAGSGLPPQDPIASSGQQQHPQLGFFASLRDTRFDHLITPTLIRFLYIVSVIVLAIGAIVFIIAAFVNSAGSGVVTLILAPVIAFIYLIMVRLYLELVVVAFKIRDAAERVAENTSKPGA
ncbi:MAG: DUF4282 domain-containing protein [Solirubrobacterales bacterium]